MRDAGTDAGFAYAVHLLLLVAFVVLVAVAAVALGGVADLWNALPLGGQLAVAVAGLFALGPFWFELLFWPLRVLWLVRPPRFVSVWDAETGERVERLIGPRGDHWIQSLSFSTDGERLVGGSTGGHAYVWTLAGGELSTLRGIGGLGWQVAFADDPDVILTGAGAQPVDRWRTSDRTATGRLQEGCGWIDVLALSPDRTLIALASGAHVRILSADTGETRRTLEMSHQVQDVVFSTEGRLVAAVAVDELRVWDVASGELRRERNPSHGRLDAVACARDAVAVAGDGTGILVVDLESGATRWHVASDAWIYTLAMSPDGRRLAAQTSDGTLCIHDMSSGRRLVRCHAASIDAPVAFSPDGRRVAVLDER